MNSNISLFVCDSLINANKAKAFLEAQIPAYTVTMEQVTNAISYDAVTYSSGVADAPTGLFLVTGRR